MKHSTAIWCFLLALAIHGVCGVKSIDVDPLLIEISNGLLRGKDNNGLYYSWEAIPYAEPPVGKLRFEAPQPYEHKWSHVFDASVMPPLCMQWDQFQEGENKLTGVEDCLTVNIYKPISQRRDNFPVLAYIHGGCFMFGGVSGFGPDLLMASGKVMVVHISYRLGPLGFLSTEDEVISGNYGLKDQKLALQWIKENIDKFGGDPKKIMLSGFSAGGASAHLQMLQTSLQDIAKVAVSFSGVALNPWIVISKARENAFKLGSLMNCPLNCNTLELKKCLQSQKAEDLVTAVKYFHNIGYNPFTVFGPVVEHQNAPQAFMTQHPRDIIKSGHFSHIPWLASYTTEDGGYNAAELLQINPLTGKEFIYDLNDYWLDLAPQNLFLQHIKDNPIRYATELKARYMGNRYFSVENYWEIQKIYTDVLFKDGILESLKLHAQHSQAPVYAYVYDNPADYSVGSVLAQRRDIYFGTNHMDDMSLIMNVTIRSPPRPDEVIISEKLIKMLEDFVETGELSYGNCEFENNSGCSNDYVKIMLISKDNSCVTLAEKVYDIY